MDEATRRVTMVLDNEEAAYRGVRLTVGDILREEGRFRAEPNKHMVEYDQLAGQAVREWIGDVTADNPAAASVFSELMSMVSWGEIGKEIHSELVKEYADDNPEEGIFLPDEDRDPAPTNDNGNWFTCGRCKQEIKFKDEYGEVPTSEADVRETRHRTCIDEDDD